MKLIHAIGIFLLIALGVSSPAIAAEDSRVPLPAPAKAFKGEQCVEPAADMRRNHYEYLLHQRDETLRQGIRGKKYSLRQCVECHAVPDPKIEGSPRTLEPFCAECHAYAAVRIDCFECHTAKAEDSGKTSKLRLSPHKDKKKLLLSELRAHLSQPPPTDTAPEKGSSSP
jgi:hypothetical protein